MNRSDIKPLILIALFFTIFLFIPSQDIKCSKYKGTCSIYSNSAFTKSKLDYEFNIADIENYEITKHRHSAGRNRHYTSYGITIYLKSGEKVVIENETRSKERAEEIYYDMITNDYYILKGNLLKTILRIY